MTKYITSLSLAAIMVVASGCGEDDAVTQSNYTASAYSNAALRSQVVYGLDDLGNRVVDSNVTVTYSDKNVVAKIINMDYTYETITYDDDRNDTKNGIFTNMYTVNIEECIISDTTEKGRIKAEKCTETVKYSINGSEEKEYKDLSPLETQFVTPPSKSITNNIYTYSANEEYILQKKVTEIDFNYDTATEEYKEENSTLNDVYATTYSYDSFSDNNNSGFKQVVIKSFKDVGSLDANNSIVSDRDGQVELIGKTIKNFSYNENGNIDIENIQSFDSAGIFYTKDPLTTADSENTAYTNSGNFTLQYESDAFFIYAEDSSLDYVTYDTTNVTTATKLVYTGSLLTGFTNTTPNYNNDALNRYDIVDSKAEYIYEGNKVTKLIFDSGNYAEVKYADFDNEVYAMKPINNYMRLNADKRGETIYSE